MTVTTNFADTFFRSEARTVFSPAGGEGMPPSRCAGAAPASATKDCPAWPGPGFALITQRLLVSGSQAREVAGLGFPGKTG